MDKCMNTETNKMLRNIYKDVLRCLRQLEGKYWCFQPFFWAGGGGGGGGVDSFFKLK